MRVEMYNLVFDSPGVSFYLWSPWRCTALEHRLFEAVKALPNIQFEPATDELRLHVADGKTWKAGLTAVARVMKGWQEEARDVGDERRTWRWLIEADTDDHGYDHAGERASVWSFLRIGLEKGNPDEPEKAEEIDLNGFGVRFWGADEGQ
jgi:hypothetical protein